MARNRDNPEAGEQRVVDSEGQTAPVTGTQQPQPAQQAQEPARQQQAQQVSGSANIKYVGRGTRYADGEKTYEHGQAVEVDAETANRLLSAKDTRGQQQFVQAD